MGADDRISGATDSPRRLPARKDRDRILYASEFRRLAGVTQVASATERLLIHNRVTHSFKVEQIAMSVVAQHDADVTQGLTTEPALDRSVEWRVAAAGLGHDIGHPPFGHIGEVVLHEMLTCTDHREFPRRSWFAPDRTNAREQKNPCPKCLLEDGFEGNAQSFRVLTKLTVRGKKDPTANLPYRQGLDLTRGTLAGVSKYPWLRGDNPDKPGKWGAYDCDAVLLAWALDAGTPDVAFAGATPSTQTLEARIMDWADDITYAVHDIDDFYRLHLIPLDSLRRPGHERDTFFPYAFAAAPRPSVSFDQTEGARLVESTFATYFPEEPFRETPFHVGQINGMVSDVVDQLMGQTSIKGGQLSVTPNYEYLNSVLKQLTWYYVIDNPALAGIQEGQRRVLSNLFRHIFELAEGHYLHRDGTLAELKRRRRLPSSLCYFVDFALQENHPLQGYSTERQRLARGVTDFIASLTDYGAYRLHARLTGDATTSILMPDISV